MNTLERAIAKAIENGWVPNDDWEDYARHAKNGVNITHLKDEQYRILNDFYSIESLIFSHDFAKALWGTKDIADQMYAQLNEVTWSTAHPAWQVHLQRMVIAPDPIKYLEVNI